MSEWIPVKEKKPRFGQMVWIHDQYYHGVTLGFYERWWTTWRGSDDVSVTHWMPVEYPQKPDGVE